MFHLVRGSVYFHVVLGASFPPGFFTVKLVCFIDFPRSSYLVLFTISLGMILTFVYFNKVYS